MLRACIALLSSPLLESSFASLHIFLITPRCQLQQIKSLFHPAPCCVGRMCEWVGACVRAKDVATNYQCSFLSFLTAHPPTRPSSTRHSHAIVEAMIARLLCRMPVPNRLQVRRNVQVAIGFGRRLAGCPNGAGPSPRRCIAARTAVVAAVHHGGGQRRRCLDIGGRLGWSIE